MKKFFHKLCDFALALLALMTMSACCGGLNTLNDPHFTEEGTLIKKPSFAKLDYNSDIHFYIESSGSMNGFFRAGQPTSFKQDVYEIMSYYSPVTKDVNIMTNSGGVAGQLSLGQFQTAMNTGALECNASTQVPVMLRNIVSRLKKNDVAVLISDMKYSPVGSAAPAVLLTQYAAEVARIAGNSKKAYSLICAISDYINKEGRVVTNESPYYYLVIGEQDKVSAVRDGIAIMLQRQKRFVDNLETGYKYASCPYDFGVPKNVVRLEKQPTFYGYGEAVDECVIPLKLKLESYRWLMSNKDTLKQCFTCKTKYGSTVSIESFDVEECNNVNLELKRSAVATIKIKVSNMPSDMEVLEWNINIPYAKSTTMGKFLDDSKGENDVTTSYSLTSFIRGIGQGEVVNYQPKPNYILISKNSL